MTQKHITNWFNKSVMTLAIATSSTTICSALDVKVTGVPGSGQTTWVFNATEDALNSTRATRLSPINKNAIGGSPLINEFKHQKGDITGEIVNGDPELQGNNNRGFIVSGGAFVSGRAYGLETNGTESPFEIDEIAFDNNTEIRRVSQGFFVIDGTRQEVFRDEKVPNRSDTFIWGLKDQKLFQGREKIIFENYTLTFDIDITSFGEGSTRIRVSGDNFSVSSNKALPLTMNFEAIGPPTPIADLISYDNDGERILLTSPSKALATQETGTNKGYTFRLENIGERGLDIKSVSIGGANASEFSLVLPDISKSVDLATDESLNYTINFNPKGESGMREATVNIESNDEYVQNFSFQINALALSRDSDQDNDNLSDWAEFSLQDLGFNYASSQVDLVNVLLDNAELAGLGSGGSSTQVNAELAVSEVNETTNTADLVIQLSSSSNLRDFTPMTLSSSRLQIDADGNIRYTIDAGEGVNFFNAGFK